MKRGFIVVAFALVLAVVSYALTRSTLPATEEDQLTWLKREFKLDPAQVRAVEEIQASYQLVCAEHCRLILETRAKLAAAPADATLQGERIQLETQCNAATLQHLRAVAAQMSAKEGLRFLALVEPRISGQEHQGPLGLK